MKTQKTKQTILRGLFARALNSTVLKVILLVCVVNSTASAQIPVTDFMANISQKANNVLTKAISGLVKLQSEINNDALTEAKKTTKTVDDHLKLVEKIYENVDGLEDLRRVVDMFGDIQRITRSISVLSGFIDDPSVNLPKKDKDIIKKGIDLSLDDIKIVMETLKFTLNDKNKIGVGERLKEFENASVLLDRASDKLYEGKEMVRLAKSAKEYTDKRNKYYNLKYQ